MRLVSLLLLAGLAPPLSAQAPIIGPAGDPSIDADTIYRLAVDPADHPGEPYIFLLDDGVLRFEADGRGTRTYRQIVQVLTREAAEAWGEQTFGYSASREKLTLNWARVLRPDGSVVADRPAHEQESDAPVAEAYPVFTDQRLRRISLGGIEPGTIVDYSYTIETVEPVLPGDFLSAWNVTTGRPTRRSRLVVDVPASIEPRIRARNIPFEPTVTVVGGRRVYTWAAAEIEKVEPEPFAADSNGVLATIEIAAPIAWDDVARWYHALSRDRYVLTPEIEKALAGVLAGAAPPTTRSARSTAGSPRTSATSRSPSGSAATGRARPRRSSAPATATARTRRRSSSPSPGASGSARTPCSSGSRAIPTPRSRPSSTSTT